MGRDGKSLVSFSMVRTSWLMRRSFATALRWLAIAAVIPFLAACEEVVDFSGQPREEVIASTGKADLTPIYVAERIDVSGIQSDLSVRIPPTVTEFSDRLRKALCAPVNGETVCRDAIVTGKVEREGEPRLTGSPAGLEVQIPLRVELKARRVGRAGDDPILLSTRTIVTATIQGSLDENWLPSMRFNGTFSWSETPVIAVAQGSYSFKEDVERVLSRRLEQWSGQLAAQLQSRQLKAMTESTWRALQSPVQIGEGPAVWLLGEPVDVQFGGFALVSDSRTLLVRSAVLTRLRTVVGDRPTPLWPRAMAALSQANETARGVVLPVDVSYDQLAAGLDSTQSRGSVTTPEAISYTIKSLRLQPAGSRLAVTTDLSLGVASSMHGLRGFASYLTTPEVREGDQKLRFTQAQIYAPETLVVGYRKQLRPVLETAVPERLEQATVFDLGPSMQKAMSLVNSASDRRLAEGLRLSGQVDGWKVRSAEPGRLALRLNVEFQGEFTVTDDRADIAGAVSSGEPALAPQ